MNPELLTSLNLAETLANVEVDRLQTLIETEEEKVNIDDEKVEKLTDQMSVLEYIVENINTYKTTLKE